ncbi:hypothetical protein BJP36_42435 [Moorena producens JHB]|uniref:Uncharacterized protein n=1 Tax=Moorena producens (strain JHB) TaxID=1454205 RepID=A0A9Q9SSV7_MOOP1|nr:hypothetical protein [Moorena producens]WAN69022.1 hypothetical protein BJP36_42435 [Moorena producens JHB]
MEGYELGESRGKITSKVPNCPADVGENPTLEETRDSLSGHTEQGDILAE